MCVWERSEEHGKVRKGGKGYWNVGREEDGRGLRDKGRGGVAERVSGIREGELEGVSEV